TEHRALRDAFMLSALRDKHASADSQYHAYYFAKMCLSVYQQKAGNSRDEAEQRDQAGIALEQSNQKGNAVEQGFHGRGALGCWARILGSVRFGCKRVVSCAGDAAPLAALLRPRFTTESEYDEIHPSTRASGRGRSGGHPVFAALQHPPDERCQLSCLQEPWSAQLPRRGVHQVSGEDPRSLQRFLEYHPGYRYPARREHDAQTADGIQHQDRSPPGRLIAAAAAREKS